MKSDESEVKQQNNETKNGFFKKVWYSIYKIEKYPELSAEGLGRAVKYLICLIIIVAIVSSMMTIFQANKEIKVVAEYIDTKIPNLSYNDEKLTVDSQDAIVDNLSDIGKVIIDTNVDKEEKINEYINEVNEDETGIIVLKDKIIVKEKSSNDLYNYTYKDLLQKTNITEFDKDKLVKSLTGAEMTQVYMSLFVSVFIYRFVLYLINTLFNIVIISICGYLATYILKLKMRYVAVFNMVIYAITLPAILQMLYIIVNAFTNFYISYFDIMYTLIASIYMMAAIFILKSDTDKKQKEVQRIVEVENELKQKDEDADDKEQNKETDKKDKKDKKKKRKEEPNDEEPQGSNA